MAPRGHSARLSGGHGRLDEWVSTYGLNSGIAGSVQSGSRLWCATTALLRFSLASLPALREHGCRMGSGKRVGGGGHRSPLCRRGYGCRSQRLRIPPVSMPCSLQFSVCQIPKKILEQNIIATGSLPRVQPLFGCDILFTSTPKKYEPG